MCVHSRCAVCVACAAGVCGKLTVAGRVTLRDVDTDPAGRDGGEAGGAGAGRSGGAGLEARAAVRAVDGHVAGVGDGALEASGAAEIAQPCSSQRFAGGRSGQMKNNTDNSNMKVQRQVRNGKLLHTPSRRSGRAEEQQKKHAVGDSRSRDRLASGAGAAAPHAKASVFGRTAAEAQGKTSVSSRSRGAGRPAGEGVGLAGAVAGAGAHHLRVGDAGQAGGALEGTQPGVIRDI